jgi:hypothetical protein
MPGFDNDCLYMGGGIDTRGVTPIVNQMSDGKLLIGSTAAPYIVANALTSADSSVIITNGAGTIDLRAGAAVSMIFTAENATTCVPVLNNLNIVGTATNGINTTAAGNTMTVSMASPFVGDFIFENNTVATPRTLMVENNDTDPGSYACLAVSTETGGGDAYVFFEVDGAVRYYSMGIDNSVAGDPFKITNNVNPSTGDNLVSMTSAGVITLFNDLDVTEGGTGVSTLTSHGILMGNGAGDINATAEPTNGQILIGSTGNFPTLGTITAGIGITVTNAAGSITIASTTGGFTWTDATNAAYNLAAQNGFVTNRGGGVTYTLPATGVLGDNMKIVGKSGLTVIAQNANQQVCIGNVATTVGVGGTLTATDAGDCLELTCITAGASTVWRTNSVVGNWAVV